jgi:hypothetical protein
MPNADTADASEAAPTVDLEQATELRTTAKWLVAASASIATLVIAGLQLGDLPILRASEWWITLLAVLAASAVIVAVGRTLYQAAAVLAASRPAIDELRGLERVDWKNYPAPRLEPPANELIKYLVVDRRQELLGQGRDSIADLAEDLQGVRRIVDKGGAATIRGRRYNSSDPRDLVALKALREDLERRMRHISAAAGWYEIKLRYREMTNGLRWNGVTFVVGAIGFALLITLPPSRKLVDGPVQAEITVPSEKAAKSAGLDKRCAGKILSGVIVGGTLDLPIVVTRPKDDCGAHRVNNTRDLVVIPIADKPREG